MEPRQYAELVLEGWAPPEEVARYERRIDTLEEQLSLVQNTCPQCGRVLPPKRCEHCDGEGLADMLGRITDANKHKEGEGLA